MSSPFADNTAERLTLEWLEYGVQMGIPRSVLETATLHTRQDEFCDHLLAQLRVAVLSDELASESFPLHFERDFAIEETTGFSMPATWWDHWKRDHRKIAKRLRLKPVRWVKSFVKRPKFVTIAINETATIERKFAYPDRRLALPEQQWGKPVLVEQWKTPW